ncbi:MFS transporter [Pantoea sp. Mb-10]|uniref:MFS transporter n=1 Tax=unclassified Pantoea TaxID=2630326 RepID=UPI001E51B762|nr:MULTISPECIES: MFS transporter [unclassified Pantoea]MCE0491876.1 MFS transporter [Pantoea sp. Mb-10]MCE0503386.1 MFS transporter [Pantoea sp. Pb-8]
MTLRSLQALCLVNFFMADVRDGLGPFLGIFLTQHHWQADTIGWVMTAGGLAGLVATIPAGLITDATTHKRLLLMVGSLVITTATLMLWFFPQTGIAVSSQVMTGMAAALIGPVLTGITLGLTGPKKFSHQMGINEAFNHGGNMFAAIIAGFAFWYWGTGAVFVLMTVMALFAALAVTAIRPADIDHRLARGLGDDKGAMAMPRLSLIARNPAILIIGLTLLLFHLSNAALLPMLSMRVAASHSGASTAGVYAAATVVISQLVMIPVALFAAARAEKVGYGWLITAALLILPVRAAIASAYSDAYAMIPIQILDGLAAGLLGVAVPAYIVKILSGSGHTNAGQGMIMVMQGIGASMSPALAGSIASTWSYSIAFAVLGCIALSALAIWWAGSRFTAGKPAEAPR